VGQTNKNKTNEQKNSKKRKQKTKNPHSPVEMSEGRLGTLD